jgi:hypothetical protein
VRVMVSLEASSPARLCLFKASLIVFFMPMVVMASVDVGVGGETGESAGEIAEGAILRGTYRYSVVGGISFGVVRLCLYLGLLGIVMQCTRKSTVPKSITGNSKSLKIVFKVITLSMRSPEAIRTEGHARTYTYHDSHASHRRAPYQKPPGARHLPHHASGLEILDESRLFSSNQKWTIHMVAVYPCCCLTLSIFLERKPVKAEVTAIDGEEPLSMVLLQITRHSLLEIRRPFLEKLYINSGSPRCPRLFQHIF